LATWGVGAIQLLESCPALAEDAPVEDAMALQRRKMEALAVGFFNRVLSALG
jgi:hypothetical protein